MIIDCISDLHGFYPELEGGDLLIVAGDLTARDLEAEVALFDYWLNEQKYKHKIVVAGNHDNVLQEGRLKLQFGTYLCDSSTEFVYETEIPHPFSSNEIDCPFPSGPNIPEFNQVVKKLKIWGSPWTKRFEGMNPKAMAFTLDTEEELAEKWALIPEDVDILVTHGPSFGNLDYTKRRKSVGSLFLWMHLLVIRPKLHVFGHVHEAHGYVQHYNGIHLVNASHVNERYEPVNKPIRVVL